MMMEHNGMESASAPEGSVALIFPGLGSEREGMGAGLPEAYSGVRELYAQAERIWGQKYYNTLLGVMDSGGPDLHRIEHSLPALFLVCMATVCALQEESKLPLPQIAHCVAGHSVGELAAATAVGCVNLEDMLRIVRCKAQTLGKMTFDPSCAVLVVRAAADTVSEYIRQAGVGESCWVANINAPDQTVISGEQKPVEALARQMKQDKVTCLLMPISIPVHTPLLQSLSDALGRALNDVEVSEPRIPFVASTTGRVVPASDVRKVLAGIPVEPVDWPGSVRCLIQGLSVTEFVTCGPGRVLSGLVRKNCPQDAAIHLHTLSSVQDIKDYCARARLPSLARG